MTLRRRLATLPGLGRVLVAGFRLKTTAGAGLRPLGRYASWLLTSREFTNYTYDLTERNRRHLAAFVAEVAGVALEEAESYVEEIGRDDSLREHVRRALEGSEEGRFADPEPRFGRRIGWYALARAAKPRVVVETGVDKGLGSVALTAALLRNARDGRGGRYYGTDLDPRAGYLLRGEYAACGTLLRGDSIESLNRLTEPIDLFINDSDHSAEYEAREYAAIEPKLSATAIVLGDNAHATDELLRFARRTGRRFLFFREQPERHWYPGAGIGAAFRRDP